jgi:hypothetical protein
MYTTKKKADPKKPEAGFRGDVELLFTQLSSLS